MADVQQGRASLRGRSGSRIALRLAALACLAATLAAHQTGQAQPSFTDPAPPQLPTPTGRFAVGTITYAWADPLSEEIVTPDPFDMHEVMVQLWYPASPSPGATRVAYIPDLKAMKKGVTDAMGERGPRMAQRLHRYGRVDTVAVAGATPVKKPAKLPVLLFSPGGNMSRHFYTAQAQELASHGYVVAIISHAHAGFDVFSGGRFLMSDPQWEPLETADYEARERHLEKVTDYLAADVRYVMDRIVDLNHHDPSGRFTRRLDRARVALLGHSRGGRIAYRACATDDRLKAAVIFDSAPPKAESESGLQQPVLLLRAADWQPADAAPLQAFFRSARAPVYEVTIQGAGHMNFCDSPLLDPKRFRSEIAPRRALRIVNDYTLAFLDLHFNGVKSPLLDGPSPDHPEATLKTHHATKD